MPRPAVSHCCLAEHIRDVLAERIVDGTYPPGHRLVELSVAKEFGTSQAPVREALKSLEGMRLVESVARRGTRVRQWTDREMVEWHEVRAALEELAGQQAAPCFGSRPGAVEELRALNARLAKELRKGDVKAVAAANAEFHRLILTASGNKTLCEVWETFAMQPRSAACLATKRIEMTETVAQHEGIVAALAKGDPGEAGRLLKEHALHFARMHENLDRDG